MSSTRLAAKALMDFRSSEALARRASVSMLERAKRTDLFVATSLWATSFDS
jgi:spore coat polysaccharide biosynthesis protein SpsF (cytidylyltransferase family)